MRFNPLRPIEQRARGAVRDAIARMQIAVPDQCEVCQAKNRKCSDGRRYLQAHHPDYTKPLLINWLCPKCHRAETPLPSKMGGPNFGESNGSSKLSLGIAKDILRRREGGETLMHISRELGIPHSTIGDIVHGRTWIAAREATQ